MHPPGHPPADAPDLIDALLGGLRATADAVVPAFLEHMPPAYFREVHRDAQLAHLRAIVAARASGQPVAVTLQSDDGRTTTFIHERDQPGLLADLLDRLPTALPLSAARVHSALDGSLVLDTFEFGELARFDPSSPEGVARQAALAPDDALAAHLRRCADDYVHTVSARRLRQHHALFDQVSGTDDVAVVVDPADEGRSTVTVAAGNAEPRWLFARIARLFARRGIDVRRAHLDLLPDPPHAVCMLTFVVHGEVAPIKGDIQRARYVDDAVLDSEDLVLQETLHALCSLAHQLLCPEDGYRFARARLHELARRYRSHAERITRLLLARFDPDARLSSEAWDAAAAALATAIDREIGTDDGRRVLHTLAACAGAVLRCNAYVDGRHALAFRLDPALFAAREPRPYGVFFVHGRGLDGFHVRFRDVARGGVRAVCPRTLEQYVLESERLYDECHGLARAQQLKNKDIPEGGSKAVVLLAPDAPLEASVKAFVDGLLDLISPDPAVRARRVDLRPAPEPLFLGPDENISPALIEWIVDRAARRGMPTATAFMSSKPGAGINHKAYGVTSEGVVVFLEEALRHVGIDPADGFTIKLTGGPDGDVAGNTLRILHRAWGTRARVVGIADGSGSAEDPEGLDHDELLRLFDEAAPIAAFDRARLGPGGRVVPLSAPGGAVVRNTLHERLVCDAFVPAGGRPATIHAGNWSRFLTPEGPSSRVIVEGANLFLTPEARLALSERGVLVVQDSSANKGGVITSSFEVIASMVLDDDTFLEVKDAFVGQVLERLRHMAREEARLLFREHARDNRVPLPVLSTRLSQAIIATSDAIVGALDTLDPDQVWEVVLGHLPEVLVAHAGDRLRERLPASYRAHIVGARVASHMAYREGLAFLEGLDGHGLASLAGRYLAQERETHHLIAEIEASGLPHAERIATLLRQGGTRAALALGDRS